MHVRNIAFVLFCALLGKVIEREVETSLWRLAALNVLSDKSNVFLPFGFDRSFRSSTICSLCLIKRNGALSTRVDIIQVKIC